MEFSGVDLFKHERASAAFCLPAIGPAREGNVYAEMRGFMPTTMPDCDDRADRASYRRFGELVLDFERGSIGRVKTVDVARIYRVSPSTAYRWMLTIQGILYLRMDRDGYWVKRLEN